MRELLELVGGIRFFSIWQISFSLPEPSCAKLKDTSHRVEGEGIALWKGLFLNDHYPQARFTDVTTRAKY